MDSQDEMEIGRNMQETKERQLYNALAYGKTGNFDANLIYELSKDYIYQMICSIVSDEQQRMIVFQTVYQRIFQEIYTLSAPEYFYIWAGKMVTDESLNQILRVGQEFYIIPDDNVDFPYNSVLDDTEKMFSDTFLEDLERQRILAARLNALSILQKIIMQYFYYDGSDVQSIADRLGMTPKQVKKELQIIRGTIKDTVTENDIPARAVAYSFSILPILPFVLRNAVEYALVAPVTISMGELLGTLGLGGAIGQGGVAAGAGTMVGQGAGTAGVVGQGGAGVGVVGQGGAGAGVVGQGGAGVGVVGQGGAAAASSTGAATSTVGAVATKTAMTIGAKIAIGFATAAAATAISVGVITYIEEQKEPEPVQYVANAENEGFSLLNFAANDAPMAVDVMDEAEPDAVLFEEESVEEEEEILIDEEMADALVAYDTDEYENEEMPQMAFFEIMLFSKDGKVLPDKKSFYVGLMDVENEYEETWDFHDQTFQYEFVVDHNLGLGSVPSELISLQAHFFTVNKAKYCWENLGNEFCALPPGEFCLPYDGDIPDDFELEIDDKKILCHVENIYYSSAYEWIENDTNTYPYLKELEKGTYHLFGVGLYMECSFEYIP